jgi:hypothetical protein
MGPLCWTHRFNYRSTCFRLLAVNVIAPRERCLALRQEIISLSRQNSAPLLINSVPAISKLLSNIWSYCLLL